MSLDASDLVAVDIGNTALKAAIFSVADLSRPLDVFRTPSHQPDLEAFTFVGSEEIDIDVNSSVDFILLILGLKNDCSGFPNQP